MPVVPDLSTNLATSGELAVLLQRTFTDAEEDAANLLLAGVSDAIRTFTRQTLSLVEDDELVQWADWTHTLWLPERPVVTLTSITVEGTLIDPDTYTWDQSGEVRFGPGMFAGGSVTWRRRRATIVYSHGFDPIPGDIKGVCLEMVQVGLSMPDGRVVRSESVGPDSITYATDNAAVMTKSQELRLRAYRPALTSVPITA